MQTLYLEIYLYVITSLFILFYTSLFRILFFFFFLEKQAKVIPRIIFVTGL